ncbi:MAG: hypothetical protein ACRELY_06525, partial [Polyangiaceae bacterium]
MDRRLAAASVAVMCFVASIPACFDFGALDAGSADGGACGAGQKACVGTCVAETDPSSGCSGPCTACAEPTNAQAACILQNGALACGLGVCNPKYADCDNNPANGCETQLTVRAHCGSCGNDCNQEFCETQGTASICSATCDAPNTLCPPDAGAAPQECVDTTTDTANCGACGVNCAVPNGVGSCDNSTCNIACDANYFLCAGACVLPSDSQCGASCARCSPPSACDTAAG